MTAHVHKKTNVIARSGQSHSGEQGETQIVDNISTSDAPLNPDVLEPLGEMKTSILSDTSGSVDETFTILAGTTIYMRIRVYPQFGFLRSPPQSGTPGGL